MKSINGHQFLVKSMGKVFKVHSFIEDMDEANKIMASNPDIGMIDEIIPEDGGKPIIVLAELKEMDLLSGSDKKMIKYSQKNDKILDR
jgi:hypothetical protein